MNALELTACPSRVNVQKLTLFFKNGTMNACKSYRPISTLPIFRKILVKKVNAQILEYLEKETIIQLKINLVFEDV